MPTDHRRHNWAVKDREYLVLLKLRYARKCVAPVVNHLLAKVLAKEGFRTGITGSALDKQFEAIRDGGKDHHVYAEIADLSEARVEIEYRGHLRDIEVAAKALKLTLERRGDISRQHITHSRNRSSRVKAIRDKRTRRPSSRRSSPEVTVLENTSSLRRRRFAQRVSSFFSSNVVADRLNASTEITPPINHAGTLSPRLRIDTDSHGTKALTRPVLLFRYHENPAILRARRFRDPSVHVPTPKPFGSRAYRQWAIPHLEMSKPYPSPLMSFAQNAHNAIRRIELIRSENFDNKAFLVVFAFNDIEADALRNFGAGAGPHPASMLFKGETSTLPDGYTGSGEWLVYGYIDCEPLLVLDAVEAVRLARSLRRFRSGGIEALEDISVCLRNAPSEWRQVIAHTILKNYCGKKMPGAGTPPYREMMKIIVDGGARSTAGLTGFSGLSVAEDDDDAEYEDDSNNGDEEQDDDLVEITTLGQRLADNRKTDSLPHLTKATLEPPTQPDFGVSLSTGSTVTNLNSFNTTAGTANRRDGSGESTPLWSPDRSESHEPGPVVRSAPAAEIATLIQPASTTNIDDDFDWDLIEDNLEDSYIKSFPSAAKRTEKLHAAPTPPDATFTGFDDEEEEEETETEEEKNEEEFVMPSIEIDRYQGAPVSHDRGNFLRGLTAHAARDTSESSVIDTPSKPPRKVANVRTQTKDSAQVSVRSRSETTRAKQGLSSDFNFNFPVRSVADRTSLFKRVGHDQERPIDLTRLDPFTARGTITTTKASANRRTQIHKPNPQPGTTIRTKVPVIVRKTIVDD